MHDADCQKEIRNAPSRKLVQEHRIICTFKFQSAWCVRLFYKRIYLEQAIQIPLKVSAFEWLVTKLDRQIYER